MALVPWTLTDNSTGTPEVFTFPINPVEHKPPNRQANITEETSSAPNGQVIMFQGRDRLRKGSFSGAVLTVGFYTDLDAWANKWYPLIMTDDAGQAWAIMITEIDWARVKRVLWPYRHNYTINYTVVG